MRNFIYISFLSIFLSVALATELIGLNSSLSPCADNVSTCHILHGEIERFHIEETESNMDFILTGSRNSVSARCATNSRNTSSRRNSINRIYSQALFREYNGSYYPSFDSSHQTAALHPFVTNSNDTLLVKLRKFRI